MTANNIQILTGAESNIEKYCPEVVQCCPRAQIFICYAHILVNGQCSITTHPLQLFETSNCCRSYTYTTQSAESNGKSIYVN